MFGRAKIAGLMALIVCAAVPAWAEAPICFWDSKARSFDGAPDLSTISLATYPNNFVATYSTVFSDTDPNVGGPEAWNVLHHCPSDNFLAMRVSTDDAGSRITQRFYDLMDAPEEISMNALAEDLRAKGADVWIGRGGIGNCDCQFAYPNGEFE